MTRRLPYFQRKDFHLFFIVIVLTFVSLVTFFQTNETQAAALTSKLDTLSRLADSTVSNHQIDFTTPTGVDADTDTITITFPAGFTMNAIAFGDMDLEVDATCDGTYETSKTLAATPSTSPTWGAALSGQVITFTAPTNATAGEIGAGECVRIQLGTNASGGSTQIENPTAGTYQISIGGTFGDSGDIAIEIITNEQVVVSASVDESINFAVSDNTIGFGTLLSGSARYATGTTGSGSETEAHTITVGTNATSGYTLTVNGATLTSGSDTITAIGASNTASSPGSEQFGLRATATGGIGAVSAPYSAAGFAFDTAAFPDEVGAASGSSADTTFSLRYIGNIASDTEAGTYNATLTYIATATY